MPIDESRPFIACRIAVLTISDTRNKKTDQSGDVLADRIVKAGHQLADRSIVTDNISAITSRLKIWIASSEVDVILSTGGTGLTGTDVTPEAFKTVCEKEITGFGELFRWISYKKIGTSTIQSRATAGIANSTYLFALPGSPSACKDGWDEILEHQLDHRHTPCNFVELFERLKEAGDK